jgi:hypothetical protein
MRRIGKEDAIASVCLSSQLILIGNLKLKVIKLLFMVGYIRHRIFLYNCV